MAEAPGASPEDDAVLLPGLLLWSGWALLLLLLLLGAAANTLALLAFCRGPGLRPGLRSLSNRFVVNLLVVNLAACTALLPLLLLNSTHSMVSTGVIATDLLSSAVLCSVSEGVAAGYCTASILGVLLIAVDQYYAVVDPLRYHSKVDGVRSAVMLVAAWLCALLAGLLGALQPGGAGLWASCAPGPEPEHPDATLYRRIFTAVFAVLVFVIPFAALCWIYVSIYSAAHRNSLRTRRNGSGSVAPSTPPSELSCAECRSLPLTPSSTLGGRGLGAAPVGLPVSRSAPAMDLVAAEGSLLPSRRSSLTSAAEEAIGCVERVDSEVGDHGAGRRRGSCPHAVTVTISPPAPGTPCAAPVRSASAWLVSSLRCRISNASLFRYREEGRAARVSAIVVVMALGCWAPYVALLVLRAAPGSAPHRYARHLDALALAALGAAVCISPCLFAFRNRRVQKEVRRMLCPKGALDRGRGLGGSLSKGRHGGAGAGGGGGSARRLLRHNLMASLAEDCSSPSDSNSALTISGISGLAKTPHDDASALTVSVSLLPTPLWTPHLLPDDVLAVETARSSFSSGVSSSQGSALSTDTVDE